jgi:hypothetical protein
MRSKSVAAMHMNTRGYLKNKKENLTERRAYLSL